MFTVSIWVLTVHPDRSAEVKALIGGNFKDVLKELTSRLLKPKIDEGDVAALLEATHRPSFLLNVAAQTKKLCCVAPSIAAA